MVTFILLVVGGLNWGLQVLGFNLVDKLLGAGSNLANGVYILVALSAVYEVVTHKASCKMCGTSGMPMA